ncbi:helix-turn-helix domain-containing protein [Actinoplanes sp. KI2]|uniref:helix-turn-helix domain-containing protein n=1 Tax=Actinoplanes sp. KI2 TaxID=2983315 RepID=UPI0021D56F31|nr:helix-turn-helix transcriptional regulator [Actinoplanes sp. KI2]MCU7729570.1 helix-turn-helix domain-containing protein [Actinoplanes sp. KI2]
MVRSLGDRVREMRLGRGLSQSGLARGLVSPSYVSLIEAGKRLPEQEILEAFAERLGTTPEFLATGVDAGTAREEQLSLQYAELALANGQTAEARAQFETLAGSSLFSRHAATWGAARAREFDGDLPGAIEQVEWLLDEHRAGRADAPGLLILLNTQCRLYREVGDLSHSISLGEQALAEVRRLGLTGSEDEIRLASTLVGSYWERGDWFRANLLAKEVVARAEAHGSPRSRGSAYWNASLAASSAGDVGLAVELAQRAVAMFSETVDERSLARLRTDLSWILLGRRPPDLDTAGDLLNRAYAALREIGVTTDLAYCETELARYHLAKGDPRTAVEHADRSLARIAGSDTVEAVRVRMVRAYSLAAMDDPGESLRCCEQAMRMLRARRPSRQHMAVWREAAELLVRLGRTDEALDAYRALSDCGGAPAPAWTTPPEHAVPATGEVLEMDERDTAGGLSDPHWAS